MGKFLSDSGRTLCNFNSRRRKLILLRRLLGTQNRLRPLGSRCQPRLLRGRAAASATHGPVLDSGVGPFVAHALEECIAEHTVRLCRSVKISDACVEALRLVSLAAIAAPRMPSIMAVKVFLVKSSIRSGGSNPHTPSGGRRGPRRNPPRPSEGKAAGRSARRLRPPAAV